MEEPGGHTCMQPLGVGTIDQNARPYVTDHQFAELPGAVQMYIKAQAEIGGHWERDVGYARWRNQLVAAQYTLGLGLCQGPWLKVDSSFQVAQQPIRYRHRKRSAIC
jgi:hypothetical protein